MGNFVWKIIGVGGAVVANKAVEAAYRKSGRSMDIDPRNPDTPLGESLVLVALTGTAAAVARTLMTRKAANYYRHSAGHLPKEFADRDIAGRRPL